jgi:hypothetical protein
MIPAHVLKAMARAGCTVEQLVAVVQADEEANRERLATRREKNRIYQRNHRARQQSQHLQSIVSADPLNGLEGSTPPKTLNPQSPSSLRSSGDARAREEFHDNFWPRYPNKVGKADAERSFAKARRQASLDAILAGLDRYVAKTDDRPWCNPATWLNQARWTDQPAEVPRQARAPPPQVDLLSDAIAERVRKAREDEDARTIETSYERRDIFSSR